jgi:hypothetical protein
LEFFAEHLREAFKRSFFASIATLQWRGKYNVKQIFCSFSKAPFLDWQLVLILPRWYKNGYKVGC